MSGFIRVSSKSRFHGYPEDAPSMSGINIQTAMLLGVDPDACEVGTELLGRCGLATMRLSTVAELASYFAKRSFPTATSGMF